MRIQDEEILQRTSLFRFLPEQYFGRLRPLLKEENFEFGDVIVHQGDPADSFYVLLSGRARAIKTDQNGMEIALATLRPGDVFGEAALGEGGTRNAMVRCSTAVTALKLNRSDFLALSEEVPEIKQEVELIKRHRSLQGFLYEFSNFGRLPTPALRSVVEKLSPVEVSKGNLIIRQGDAAGPMYILEKGRARAFAGNNGRETNLAFYRDGDFFGELSILNGSPRAASVEAFSDCRLLTLAPESVQELKKEFPDFSKLLEERLAHYQAKTEARVPLDFSEEVLPAEVRAHNKVAIDEPPQPADSADPFADEHGLFKKRARRIRKFEHLAQIDEMDCGAASLGMICRHFGRKVSLTRIRQLCHTSTDGTSLKAMCRAATELGLAARALKVSLRNLPAMPLPAIIHWEGNHWMVLFDVNEKFVRVADPALGIRKIPRKEFEMNWSGYAALFDYTVAFEQAPESKPSLAWVLPFFKQHRKTLLQVLLLAVAVTFLQMLFPIFTQMVVDKVIVEHDIGLLKVILLGMCDRAFLRPGVKFDSAVSALVRRGATRHVHSRFSQPPIALVADELFHQPTHWRHSTPPRRRAAGAAIRSWPGHWRVAGAGHAGWFALLDDALQPVVDVRFSLHDAALRRADVFFFQGLAATFCQRGREPGKVQLTSDRRDQRHRSGQGSGGGICLPRRDVERISGRFAEDFPQQLHRDVL